jgi:hypothetical protein
MAASHSAGAGEPRNFFPHPVDPAVRRLKGAATRLLSHAQKIAFADVHAVVA